MTRKTIGIVAGVLLVLCVSAYLGLKIYIENDAKGRIRDWANQTGRISEISYQSLDVGLFSKTIQISQVSIRIKDVNSPVAVDRLILHSFDIKNEIPSFMHVEIQGIHISPDNSLMKGMSPVLAQLGYADIAANVEYAYIYEPIKKDMEIQQLRISISDMGKVEVSARINNLDLATLKAVPDNPLSLIALVPVVAISGIMMDYQDNSLTQRLIELGARQSGQSSEQFISTITEQLNSEIQRQNQPAVRDILLAFQKFLVNPGHIKVAVSPTRPVPLMTLLMEKDPNERIRVLNVSVNYQELKK
ncbi:MAG: hypothetical protein NTU74_05885 [Deltaproteobacteria bacterium]|nr:hypothetical protein [Deltaproteobacteria bacterium]